MRALTIVMTAIGIVLVGLFAASAAADQACSDTCDSTYQELANSCMTRSDSTEQTRCYNQYLLRSVLCQQQCEAAASEEAAPAEQPAESTPQEATEEPAAESTPQETPAQTMPIKQFQPKIQLRQVAPAKQQNMTPYGQ